MFMGYCIGGPYALKLIERAPERVVAAVLCQPVGHASKTPNAMYESGLAWGAELVARRPDVTMETVEKYLHNLTASSRTSCTACRGTSRARAGRRCW